MDTRTKVEKLRAMARQTESPNEAAIARRILAQIDGLPPDVAATQLDRELAGLASAFGDMGRQMAEAFAAAAPAILEAARAMADALEPYRRAQRDELVRTYRGRVYLAQQQIARLEAAADRPRPNRFQAIGIAQAKRQLNELLERAAEEGIPPSTFTTPRSPADERSPAGGLVTAEALSAQG